MMNFNRSLPDDEEEEDETVGHRMKQLVFCVVGLVVLVSSIGLLYWLGYRDGWNDRDKGVGVTDATYRSTMVLKDAGVNR